MSNRNGPPVEAQVYTGPVRSMKTGGESSELTVVQFTQTYPAVAGGSTGVNIACNTGQVSTAPDWSSFVNVFEEYRVLAFEAMWIPHYNRSTTFAAAGVAITWHNTDPTPFTSLNTMTQYDGWRPFNACEPWTGVWNMGGSDEAQFRPTSTTYSIGGVSAFAPTATSTPTGGYGNLHIIFRVQFRGRK